MLQWVDLPVAVEAAAAVVAAAAAALGYSQLTRGMINYLKRVIKQGQLPAPIKAVELSTQKPAASAFLA